jgi:diadenosine tetraphosphatase ApaH/serine/threonine PP2A family protein phosphatase
MLVLKVMYPGSVYLNRGNHEARDVNHRDGFERELLEKYGSPTLFDRFCALFCSLPLVHIVNSDLIVIHGGIMERPMTVAELNSVNRFHECPSRVPVVAELLWSDPTELHDLQIGKSKRGAGIYFGRAVFERFMATLGCSRLIRSHQCKQDGYEFAFDRRCLTLFSASNYCGKVGNYGAYAVYEKDNPLQITPYYVGEDPKRKRVTVRALNLQEAVVRKLSTRIGSNRLRLIQFFSSVSAGLRGRAPRFSGAPLKRLAGGRQGHIDGEPRAVCRGAAHSAWAGPALYALRRALGRAQGGQDRLPLLPQSLR